MIIMSRYIPVLLPNTRPDSLVLDEGTVDVCVCGQLEPLVPAVGIHYKLKHALCQPDINIYHNLSVTVTSFYHCIVLVSVRWLTRWRRAFAVSRWSGLQAHHRHSRWWMRRYCYTDSRCSVLFLCARVVVLWCVVVALWRCVVMCCNVVFSVTFQYIIVF